MSILEKFTVIDLIKTRSASVATITGNVLKFNNQTAAELHFAPYIQVLINPKDKQFAIRGCKEDAPNAVPFSKTVAKIKAAIEAAYQEGQSKLKGNSKSVPPLAAIKTPLRDGDIERPDDPAYANAYFINANSATAPGIVDADRNPVLTRSEVYSGVYGRASINLYAFNSNGNKGIACGLNNLQLIRAGEPLGGKASAESDFATDADDDFLA